MPLEQLLERHQGEVVQVGERHRRFHCRRMVGGEEEHVGVAHQRPCLERALGQRRGTESEVEPAALDRTVRLRVGRRLGETELGLGAVISGRDSRIDETAGRPRYLGRPTAFRLPSRVRSEGAVRSRFALPFRPTSTRSDGLRSTTTGLCRTGRCCLRRATVPSSWRCRRPRARWSPTHSAPPRISSSSYGSARRSCTASRPSYLTVTSGAISGPRRRTARRLRPSPVVRGESSLTRGLALDGFQLHA